MKFRDTCSNEEVDSDDLPVQVCFSGGGHYIGQLEPCGSPYSRLSGYYKNRKDAEKELKLGWPDRGADENKEIVEGLKKKGKINKICRCCGKPFDPDHPTSSACSARHAGKDCLCFKVECRRCGKQARRIGDGAIICPQCGVIKEKTT